MGEWILPLVLSTNRRPRVSRRLRLAYTTYLLYLPPLFSQEKKTIVDTALINRICIGKGVFS